MVLVEVSVDDEGVIPEPECVAKVLAVVRVHLKDFFSFALLPVLAILVRR